MTVETWDDMELYGKERYSLLKKFLELPAGIPSHDTFNRVFSLLNPKSLKAALQEDFALEVLKSVFVWTALHDTSPMRLPWPVNYNLKHDGKRPIEKHPAVSASAVRASLSRASAAAKRCAYSVCPGRSRQPETEDELAIWTSRWRSIL